MQPEYEVQAYCKAGALSSNVWNISSFVPTVARASPHCRVEGVWNFFPSYLARTKPALQGNSAEQLKATSCTHGGKVYGT